MYLQPVTFTDSESLDNAPDVISMTERENGFPVQGTDISVKLTVACEKQETHILAFLIVFRRY